ELSVEVDLRWGLARRGHGITLRLSRTSTEWRLAMEIGIYGLGRMGGNMATRLAQGGHRVVASNRSRGPVDEAVQKGAVAAYTIQEMVSKLKAPRVLWSMVPAGDVTDEALEEFAKYGTKGDVFVDGGNSNFHDSQRRAEKYGALGFKYLDIGVSGGI